MAARLVYVTCENQDEARNIAGKLVEERLAACANILPGMTAVFRWEGEIQDGSEAVLLLKTRAELVSALTDRLLALHSYDCPCVAALPIEPGNPAFFTWIDNETADPKPP